VLSLDSFGRDVAPFDVVASAFRSTLARESAEPINLYEDEAPLDLGRSVNPGMEAPFVDFLEKRFAGRRLDLVVPIGTPAVRFVAAYRDRLFPGTPILATAADPRLIPPGFINSNAVLVTSRINIQGFLEDMLQLRPDTTNVAVIFGASPIEDFWVSECRREFQPFTNRVRFTWLDHLSLARIQAEVAAPPPHTFVFFGLFLMDASGVPIDNADALKTLQAVTKAPIYGLFESELGLGTVGGRLYPDALVGERSARAAIRILRGERPETIPSQVLDATAPVYDWRELRRWDIPESRLPAGSIVRFREPTFWRQYSGRVILSLSVLLGALMLILGLTLNLIRRRQAEMALIKSEDQYRTLSRRLINAQEEERARLARELHDDVTQRLALLAIDVARVELGAPEAASSGTLHEVGRGLVQLSGDVHSLSYRLHSSVLEDLGLAEAIKAECERVSRQEAIPVEVKLRDLSGPAPRDASLCLFRVTQEALRNVARHAKARTVEVSLRAIDGGLQVAIRDDGVGFDPANHREHPSLGLASMRERVHLLEGELNIESAPGGGTLVLAWVPVKNAEG